MEWAWWSITFCSGDARKFTAEYPMNARGAFSVQRAPGGNGGEPP